MTTLQQPAPSRSRWRSGLDLAATLAVIGAAVTIMIRLARPAATDSAVSNRPALALPKDPIGLAGVPFIGSQTAKVTMLEFSDFQCPFCARFVKDTLPGLRTKYVDTGILRLGFRHNPLPIHNHAERAAESSVCAMDQGKFWPMHDALFSKPDQKESLEDKGLEEAALAAGLDARRYQTCMAAPPASIVKRDSAVAANLGLTGTPSFALGISDSLGQLVVKKFVVGALRLEDFVTAIESVARTH